MLVPRGKSRQVIHSSAGEEEKAGLAGTTALVLKKLSDRIMDLKISKVQYTTASIISGELEQTYMLKTFKKLGQ